MRLKNLIPSIELTLAAFAGGMVLSLLELMNMCTHHENISDPLFYMGMLIAGILGILGMIISRAKDIGGAVTSGIAAPQLLAGIAKTGVVQAALMLNSPVYAQPAPYMPAKDSISVTIVSESDNKILQVQPVHDTTKYFLNDTLRMRVPSNESIVLSGKNVNSATWEFTGAKTSAMVWVSSKQVKNNSDFFRGLFAQQVQKSEAKYELELKGSVK
jgi:hypothetical protein